MAKKSNTIFSDKKIVITGGTGSLGKTLLRRILSNELGTPRKLVVFSRDEAKQHEVRMNYMQRKWATDEIIYRNFEQVLEFHIGDVRDYGQVCALLHDADIVFNAAALKQVPVCEYFPEEAVKTNINGAGNIIRAIRDLRLPVEKVICVSTDKAVEPVNVMGMTKAIQERIFTRANIDCPDTSFVVVRYGNVMASRGSVVPLFQDQIRNGGPVTVTNPEMTRFLLSLDQAADLIFTAVQEAELGETYVPDVPSAKIIDVAREMIGDREIELKIIGSRPGEKLHEVLISGEETVRTLRRESNYVIKPILPELRDDTVTGNVLDGEFSSGDVVMPRADVGELLKANGLLPDDKV